MPNILIISATNDNNLELSNKLQAFLSELQVESKVVSLENLDLPLFGGKTDVEDSIIKDFVRDLSYAGPFFSKKHVAEPEGFGVGGWGNLSANNYRYMRYGMILLWLAEAEVEVGSLERARELVNEIRTRAANPDGFVPLATQGTDRNDFSIVEGEAAANYDIATYDAPWTDKAAARDAVRFETRLEFAMEGHRYWDLVRWGIAAETLNNYIASESQHRTYLVGKSFTEGKNEYFPIPSQAIDRSAVDGQPTLTQDPAY